ncbi:MAG: hypothetical protein ACR2NU_10185 [Aeoliella sp.]
MNPAARSTLVVCWILRVAVAMQCLGHAWWLGRVKDSPLMSWLWGHPDVGGFGLTESSAQTIQSLLAAFLVVAALFSIFRPARFLLVGVALFQVLLTTAMWRTGYDYYVDLSRLPVGDWSPLLESVAGLFPFAAQSARIALPLVLLFVERGQTISAQWTARIAIAAAFAAHGLEALQHFFKFTDMLIIATDRLIGVRMPELVANRLLTVIGTIDLLVAMLVISTRLRKVAWYMAMWGLITAAARIVVLDWERGGYEFATRAPHVALPLVLALWWSLAQRKGRVVESE